MDLHFNFLVLAIAFLLGNIFLHLHYRKYGDKPEMLFSGYLRTAIIFFVMAIVQCNDIFRIFLFLYRPKFDYLNTNLFRFPIKFLLNTFVVGVIPLLTHQYLNKIAQKKKRKKTLKG